MRHVFVMALVVAFVGLSLVTDKGAGEQRIVSGIVTEWRAREYIAVANEQTDPCFKIGLRDTVYEGDTYIIKRGVRVTVWYRYVGERLPVAERVRVLGAAAH